MGRTKKDRKYYLNFSLYNKHSQFSFLTSVPEGFKRVGVRKEKAGGLKNQIKVDGGVFFVSC
jgi:hypothetical protein